MKIKDLHPPETPGKKLIKGWLFTLNLFFILYSTVMLGKFLLGPQSGRISTLVCQPDPWGKLVCTVKIYGVHKLFRLDFYANDYIDTVRSNNYRLGENPYSELNDLSLPWDNGPEQSISDELVCAVSIRIRSQLVDFVPPYQNGSVCSRAQEQVKAAFAGDRSAINLRFVGINPQVYWRIAVLVVASLLFAVQCAFRLRNRQREKDAARVAGAQPGPAQPVTVDIPSGPGLPPAEIETHPEELSRKKFVRLWWLASVLVILFLVFSTALNSLVRRGFWLEDCFISVRDYQKLYLIPPLTTLIAILPFIIVITLGMALQWQVLRLVLPVSRWWIAAPLVAGIPLLVSLPPAHTCSDISNLPYPPLISDASPQAASSWSWVVYFLLFGLVQWLVLLRKTKYSPGWILVPFLSVYGGMFILLVMFYLGMSPEPLWLPNSLIIPAIISWALIMLLLATIINFVPGYYLYWAIQKNQANRAAHA